MVTNPLMDEFMLPKTQKESELSRLGNLSDIIRGSDENKIGDTHYPG